MQRGLPGASISSAAHRGKLSTTDFVSTSQGQHDIRQVFIQFTFARLRHWRGTARRPRSACSRPLPQRTPSGCTCSVVAGGNGNRSRQSARLGSEFPAPLPPAPAVYSHEKRKKLAHGARGLRTPVPAVCKGDTRGNTCRRSQKCFISERRFRKASLSVGVVSTQAAWLLQVPGALDTGARSERLHRTPPTRGFCVRLQGPPPVSVTRAQQRPARKEPFATGPRRPAGPAQVPGASATAHTSGGRRQIHSQNP